MSKLIDALYMQAFKSLAYLVILFAALGFVAWIVSKFWVYMLVVAVVALGVRIYYRYSRYW